MNEIFYNIKGYEGLYKISNFGRVLSCEREVWNGRIYYTIHDRYLKPGLNNKGYEYVHLSKDGKTKNHTIHQLVAIAFLDHKPNGYKIVVDHKDNNPRNNHVDNLQLISQRANTSKKRNNTSSQYIGVSLCKKSGNWVSKILINNKRKYLGTFSEEYDAHITYQQALNNVCQTLKKRLD